MDSSPEKNRNNTREKKRILFTCVWYRRSATDTSVPFRTTSSGWWINGKAFTIPNPRSFVKIFFNLWLLNTKKSVPLTDSDVQTLLGEEENQNTKRKAETYIFSAFGNGIFHGRERKSSTRRFTRGQFWHVPEIFLLSVRTNSIAENFIYWKLGPLFAFVIIPHNFHLECANTLYDFYSEIVDPFIVIY